jgi:superfamily II DNA/RNA helicase
LPVHADAARLRGACQIVVGTPGRLRALMQDGSLPTDHIRTLVCALALSAHTTRLRFAC